ncbi:MAG: 3'-5' exonuclease [Flavobacteriaceae bacterium]
MKTTTYALENILFLDIETVPEAISFRLLDAGTQELYTAKTAYKRKEDALSAEEYYPRAGIWAEFGKIVCISVGFVTTTTDGRQFRVHSFSGEEAELLTAFQELLSTHFSTPQHRLCAHNGKEFDFPYIARRMLKHQLELPNVLQLMGKKPWEVPHLDTLELWKFGDYKHYTSLKLLAHFFGIPSPKDDMDGSDVARVYYEENDLARIVRYCEKDVVTLAQVFLKLTVQPQLKESEIVYVS